LKRICAVFVLTGDMTKRIIQCGVHTVAERTNVDCAYTQKWRHHLLSIVN